MKYYYLLLSLTLFSFNKKNEEKKQTKKPNIVMIVADDLGYSDIGCYGGEIKTPSLDRLANNGIRLSNMNNASMCVVSRTSLLTGKWWPIPGAKIKRGTNLAQELKKCGYRTGLIGKWHLEGHPLDKGFDYFFGFLGGFSSYFNGSEDYMLNRTKFSDFGNKFYSTDELTDRAVGFIDPEKQKNEQPFFLYLSYQSPHNPLQAPKEDIMAYRGKYLKGWKKIREARIKNQIKFGIVGNQTPLASYPQNLPDWETLTPEQKDLEDLRMSVYAAMVTRMDNGIGKLMENLKNNNQKDNTIVLFLSDNGTDSFSSLDKHMLASGKLPGDNKSNYQLGTGWGYASVTPWRLYKISQHGGGVKTGAIISWPDKIKNTGVVNKTNIHIVDVMPTLLNIITPIHKTKIKFSGQSFMKIFNNNINFKRNTPMFFQYMDNRAIRTDEWSLIEVDGSGWELYNLKTDPLETIDLVNVYPEIVEKLNDEWLVLWESSSNDVGYTPISTFKSIHYRPQGDRGSGDLYIPSSMPNNLSDRYKISY